MDKRRLRKKLRSLAALSFILSLTLLFSFAVLAEQTAPNKKKAAKYRDEFSELDDKPIETANGFENTLKTLERSRQFYLQALILVEEGDTSKASWYFDRAINNLNSLASIQGIEQNQDFADLAQSIIEDYESSIQSIDNLSEDTPLFIIKDKLFEEMEGFSIVPGGNLGYESYCKELLPPADSMQIALPMNSEVQRGIDFLTKHKIGKPFFKKTLERTTKWFPMLRKIAIEEGMPQEIIYLSMIESGLNPNAVSRAKAVGMWQFMTATGKMYGLNASGSEYVDERRDPIKATRAAMRHLRDLYNQFGDWHLALAAYNVGAGGVSKRIRKSGKSNPTYWDIRTLLPKETAFYVPLYIAAAKISMDPEKYGFDMDSLNFQKEYKYDIYTLKEPTNLNAIASSSGISVDSLKSLNPELLKSTTPIDWAEYRIKLPYGSVMRFAANFQRMNDEERAPFLTHEVSRKENLNSIADKYGCEPKDIVKFNKLSDEELKAGQSIRIPLNVDDYRDQLYTDNTNSMIPMPLESGEAIMHTVRNGESLHSIARRYGVRAIDIRNLNNISFRSEGIKEGQQLIVASHIAQRKKAEEQILLTEKKKGSSAASSIALNKTPEQRKQREDGKSSVVKHTVKKGETLQRIATLYKVKVKDILADNKLKNDNIKYGQILKVTTPLDFAEAEEAEEPAQPKKIAKLKESVAVRGVEEDAEADEEETAVRQPAVKPVKHKVKRGETLASIADLYDVKENQVKTWNPGKVRGSTVYLGTTLKIYPESESIAVKENAGAKSKKTEDAKYYTIKSGDTLSSISRKFGVSIAELKTINKMENEDRLRIGQRIRIN